MGIHILSGIMRSGKGIGTALINYNHAAAGYTLVSNVDYFFHNDPQRRTNKPLDFEIIEQCLNNQMSLTQKYSTKKILVTIDELITQMDNRKSLSNNNVGLSYFALQAAKTHTSILGTSQMREAIDLRLRSFAQYFTFTRKQLYSTFYKGRMINNAIDSFEYFVYDNQYATLVPIDYYEIPPEDAYWLGSRFKTEQLIAPRTLSKKP